eukprot:6205148-Pleurochrysis_carterae.AAC.4
MVCLLFAASATAFHSPSPMKLVSDFTARSQAVQMVTVAPERTITKPPPLPDKWEVPDTFSLSSLKTPDTKEPSMFKLTLFRSRVTDARVLGALMEVVEGAPCPVPRPLYGPSASGAGACQGEIHGLLAGRSLPAADS